jgi:hypothetical protein
MSWHAFWNKTCIAYQLGSFILFLFSYNVHWYFQKQSAFINVLNKKLLKNLKKSQKINFLYGSLQKASILIQINWTILLLESCIWTFSKLLRAKDHISPWDMHLKDNESNQMCYKDSKTSFGNNTYYQRNHVYFGF